MNTSFKTFHFVSSHGELYINGDGTINKEKSDLGSNDADNWLHTIEKVDMDEWIHWNQLIGILEPDCGDSLDFGFWDKNGVYHAPDLTWRKEDFVDNGILTQEQVHRAIEKTKAWLRTYRCTDTKEITIQQLKNEIKRVENEHGNIDHIYVTIITDLF